MRKLVFLFFLLVIFGFAALNVESIAVERKTFVVYIDPGHGGADGGCVAQKLVEKDINLKLSLLLREVLMDKGYQVYMTRDGDYHLGPEKFSKNDDLHARVSQINASNADLYLSIHANKFPQEQYYGAQVFYNNIHPNNLYIAQTIQNYLCQFSRTTRKAKPITNVIILKNITIPGCLIECGFMSNPEEFFLLQDRTYLLKLARIISYGIEEYLNI